MKHRPPQLLEKFEAVAAETMGISVITLAELEHGVAKSQAVMKNRQVLEAFLSHVEIMDWNQGAARVYGEISTALERRGMVIGQMDLMIAAHALSLDSILITNNVREFERIPGLILENWV